MDSAVSQKAHALILQMHFGSLSPLRLHPLCNLQSFVPSLSWYSRRRLSAAGTETAAAEPAPGGPTS